MSRDPYQEVTDRIIAALEAGTVPWRKPWHCEAGQPRSLDGRPYTGINSILLAMSGFSDPRWATFKTAQRHGGKVRKGEKGTLVVFFKPLSITDRDKDTGKETRRSIPLLKYFYVFNVSQIDGLELESLDTEPRDIPVLDTAEQVYHDYPNRPRLAFGSDGAWYLPSADQVSMPDREHFDTAERYYLALWHELAHSTGHESRLARTDLAGMARFGDACYSREELCAEMGASMIAARVGVVEPDIAQSAAYIAGWLRALRNDRKLVISAASRAQKAADWILGPIAAPESV